MFINAFKFIYQIIPEYVRMYQIIPEYVRMYQIIPDYVRMDGFNTIFLEFRFY